MRNQPMYLNFKFILFASVCLLVLNQQVFSSEHSAQEGHIVSSDEKKIEPPQPFNYMRVFRDCKLDPETREEENAGQYERYVSARVSWSTSDQKVDLKKSLMVELIEQSTYGKKDIRSAGLFELPELQKWYNLKDHNSSWALQTRFAKGLIKDDLGFMQADVELETYFAKQFDAGIVFTLRVNLYRHSDPLGTQLPWETPVKEVKKLVFDCRAPNPSYMKFIRSKIEDRIDYHRKDGDLY